MGFEDDFDYNDDFETDIADPDNMDGGEQPKKFSRKELREAKKKNAEKTADLPKHKLSFFNRRERLDDNDEALTEEHMFDPARTTMVSGSRDRSSRSMNNSPVKNAESEFSYLFDPVDDNESEDDVYPEKSIYSDSDSAKELLSGLSYDGSDEDMSKDFDRYFEEHSKPAKSLFSFRKKKEAESSAEPDEIQVQPEPEKPEPAKPVPIKVTPKKAVLPDEESYLPELRPDSVFAAQNKTPPVPEPAPEPVSQPEDKNDPPLPPLPGQSESQNNFSKSYGRE